MDGDTLTGGRTHHRFTVFDYHRMAAAGAIPHDARTELIQGIILDMPPIGTPHMRIINGLNMLLAPMLVGRATVSVQNAIRLDDWSEPQPDIVLLKPDDQTDLSQQPTPADAYLVIEVADSSLPYDRNVKAPLYAAGAVQEYWIVDVAARALEIYRQPDSGRFQHVERLTAGPLTLPGLGDSITVEAVFKPLA